MKYYKIFEFIFPKMNQSPQTSELPTSDFNEVKIAN